MTAADSIATTVGLLVGLLLPSGNAALTLTWRALLQRADAAVLVGRLNCIITAIDRVVEHCEHLTCQQYRVAF